MNRQPVLAVRHFTSCRRRPKPSKLLTEKHRIPGLYYAAAAITTLGAAFKNAGNRLPISPGILFIPALVFLYT